MRSLRLSSLIAISLVLILLSTILLAQSSSSIADAVIKVPLVKQSAAVKSLSQPDPENRAKIHASYGNLPLSFEANQGQADSQVKFLTRTGAYSMFLTGDEAVLVLRERKAKDKDKKNNAKEHNKFPVGTRLAASPADNNSRRTPGHAPESILRMKLRHANASARVTGVDELQGKSNYFLGNDPAKWRTNVPTYSKVKYEGIYSGIDLVYYGNQRQLEYDFIVAPGANPRSIAFDISGASRIRKDATGNLVFKTEECEIRWHKPVVYQENDGTRNEIAASYSITDKNRIGFQLAKYDASKPLYIDPLIYSTYLGGSGIDQGNAIAVDSAGNAYVVGTTTSTDFPTKNALQAANGGSYNVFVTKFNPDGSVLLYSTYLGGNYSDYGYGIALDAARNVYVTGTTESTNFPTTSGAFQTVCNDGSNCGPYSGDVFLSKIDPSGSALVYSTYLGGNGDDVGYAIAVNGQGDALVTGVTQSTDFPSKNPLQGSLAGTANAFISETNPTGSALIFSTYLGGSGYAAGHGIVLDSAGNAYVVGTTTSTNFPTMNPLQPVNGGGADAFVAKINPSGSAFVYSTYLGGKGYDLGYGIAVDSAGNAYVTGFTTSADFPTRNPWQAATGGTSAFVSKINPAGSALVYSTYLGGSQNFAGSFAIGNAIAVDSAGHATLTGYTGEFFPTTAGAIPVHCFTYCQDRYHAFVTRFNSHGSALVYSTQLGGQAPVRGGQTYDIGAGIALDSAGNAFIAGSTQSTNFPTKNPFQPTYGGGIYDAFVAKMDVRAVSTITLTSSSNPSIYGQPVTFTSAFTSTIGAPPDGESVTFMKGKTILGTGTLSRASATFTTSTLPVATNAITAVYGGDSNFGPSTSTAVKQVVDKATTTTALASSSNPSTVGQTVTFTATITPQFATKVTGSVTFYDGTTALKTVAVSSNKAKLAASTLAAGSHNITATYNGSTSFTGSSASLTQKVN
jgi:hypothetical protein